MTGHSSVIRPQFILEWDERRRSENHHQWDLIDDRNWSLKDLNRKFGFVEEDQTVPIGHQTHVHSGYDRAYADAEASFRRTYNAIPLLRDDWMRRNKCTIYEYLLLDNCTLTDFGYLIDRITDDPDMNWLDVIRLRARSFLKHYSAEARLAGVRERIAIEKRLFPYAETRCRNFFGIKGWPRDSNRNTEIAQYRKFYFEMLQDEFDRMRVDLA